ncbi:MAG: glycoside hydrolase family 15 protein [Betaproteobacteria bacterium]
MMRVDGYAPIRDYALIGDGRTTALVATDGGIDWLCLPNIDSPSVFAALLDKDGGGTLTLQPSIPFAATRRYLPDTNVVETTFTTDCGAVRVVDALTIPDGELGPMRELARSIEGLGGRVPMWWRFAPRFDYGRSGPRPEWRDGVPVATWASEALAVRVWGAGSPVWDGDVARADFEIAEGARALLVLASAHSEPLVLPARQAVEARLRKTIEFWSRWAGGRAYAGPWQDMVRRSALVLKLLIFAPSGAAAAAPTTSLPEEMGGERNWDYRFCWIRDSAFLIDALLELGCRDEARALFWWFMQATALTEPKLQVLYRLDGGPHAPEFDLPLAGYRGSRPVRVGNKAAGQEQLDIYGDLLQTAWLYGRGGHALSRDTGRVLERIADLVCDIWRRPDSGIWEVRSAPQHFTHSKAMCWVALDRACRLAKAGELPSRHVDRWRREANAIEGYIESACWSERLRSYTRSAGSDAVDAALLMLPLVGYGDPCGERMTGTIDAICRTLREGCFVYRYRGEDGLPGTEGCFLNCSFWLAGAMARAGRIDEAASLMQQLVDRANDVGLYSEEVDPHTGEFLGNFPQALVHLALVDAAVAIADAADARPGGRARQAAAAGAARRE